MSILPMRVQYRANSNPGMSDRQKERYLSSNTYRLPPAQTRNAWEDKMSTTFDEYVPFSHNYGLYDMIRNSIPLIEACYTKYKMLVAMPTFDFLGNKQMQKDATEFIEKVRVNQFGRGLSEWILGLVDSALHYGNGYGELVPNLGLNDVAFLKNAPSKYMKFVKQQDGNLALGQYDEFGMKLIPFEKQDFIYVLGFWKRDGHPQGYSLLYSLPFMAQCFFYIQNSLQKTWIRIGDPTFAFIIETDKEVATAGNYESSREAVALVDARWAEIQKARLMGKFGDLSGALPPGSKIVIKTLGEGVTLPDLEISMRTVIEQLVAQTGFPLFMYGFQWGGNYNLTTHQNDMIVNQIGFIRGCIDPLIDKVLQQFFFLRGIENAKYDWEWPDVNLRDEVEQARAMQMKAQSIKLGIESRLQALDYGLLQPTSFVEWLVEEGIEDEKYLKVMSVEKVAEQFRQKFLLARAMELAGRLN